MKNILLLSIIFLLTGFSGLKAQNPIPSFQIPVHYHADFQEKSTGTISMDNGREKRNVIIRTTREISKITPCTATVWVYSLDGMTIYGPYITYSGVDLIVEIDDREWGVLVESDDLVIVDVWIE
ncbi:MAG: hypothetical protein PHF97_11340 [Bacteroidales bacterium]|nr:hypothetical protein [Bacteroidales bacterium]